MLATLPPFDITHRVGDNILSCRVLEYNESGRPRLKDKFFLPIYLDMFGIYPPDYDWITPGETAPTMSGYYYFKDQHSDNYISHNDHNSMLTITLFDDFRRSGRFEIFYRKDNKVRTGTSRLRTDQERSLYIDKILLKGGRYEFSDSFAVVGSVEDKYILLDRKTYMQFTIYKHICNII